MSRNIAYQQKCELYYDKWLQSSLAGLGLHHQELEKKWNEKNIWKNAPDVNSMFHGFKHIIEVDWQKILKNHGGYKWIPVEEFRNQFYYPNREVGDHTCVISLRGMYNTEGHFEIGEIGGTDLVFAATNNDEDATFIALKYK